MATLQNGETSLEVTFPYSRSDAVVYEFRIKWGGKAIMNPALRGADGAADPEKAEPFTVWNSGRLGCDLATVLEEAERTDLPGQWSPAEPSLSVSLFNGHRCGIGEYAELSRRVGQRDRIEELFQWLDPNAGQQGPADPFRLWIEIDLERFLPSEECNPGSGRLIVTLWLKRGQLREFFRDLRKDFEECERLRKLPPSPVDDAMWRFLN